MIDKKWNLNNLPPKGHADVAEFALMCYEIAQKEKERQKRPQIFMANYCLYRGQKMDNQLQGRKGYSPAKKATTPVNLFFANVERTVSNITARQPTGEVIDLSGMNDGSDQVLTGMLKKWWKDTSQQNKTRMSARTMEIYGITPEKPYWDKANRQPDIMCTDPYTFIPAPGNWDDISIEAPYLCYLYVDFISKIEADFKVSDVAADDAFELTGAAREDVKPSSYTGQTIGNYAEPMTVKMNQSRPDDKAIQRGIIIEVWIRDYRKKKVTTTTPMIDPITKVPAVNNETGEPLMMQVTEEVLVYRDGIRKITITKTKDESIKCGYIVLDDSENPNLNPELDTELARYTYPWGRLPAYYANSYKDHVSIWGFSAAEQVSDLLDKIQTIVNKLVAYVINVMAPPLIIQQHCGITKEMIVSKLDKSGRLVLMPSIPGARIEFMKIPDLPSTFFQVLDLIIMLFDRIYQIEDADRGVAPNGVIAAQAIVALQERNQVLMQSKTQAIDFLAEERSKWAIGLWQNFGTKVEFVNVAGEPFNFIGTKYAGRKFNYTVEAGSTTPRTSLQNQELAKWLYQVKAIGQQGLLENLNWPNYKEELERTAESQLDQALQILIDAGMPEEAAIALRQYLLSSSVQTTTNTTNGGGTGNGAPKPAKPPAGV